MSVITVERRILQKNDEIAVANRHYFIRNGIAVINLLSSPGAGKTTLLERTLQHLDPPTVMVIEGDVQTDRDAQRIAALGFRAVQIVTHGGCHLDAGLIRDAMNSADLSGVSLLFIENVGNLVCPACFDLGEDHKVVISSTTEGEDKPIKYPRVFREASLCLLNKMDLAPVVEFDQEAYGKHVHAVHPGLEIINVSAKTGQGLPAWVDWLSHAQQDKLRASR